MAYNKNNYEHNRLTPKQEEFCQQIMLGKTQYESYITAYPKSKKWTRATIDVAANHMMSNNKIIIRLKELGYKDAKKVEWTRQKALETINYVMDMNRQDMERIAEAYQTELDIYEVKLNQKKQEMTLAAAKGDAKRTLEIAGEMQDITNEMQQLRKQRRTNATNIKGIFEGAKILNRMFGYDITKVEISNQDEEKDELNKLNADELKAVLANINKE